MKSQVTVVFTLVLGWMQGTALPLAAAEKMPALQGAAATSYLKQQGLYGSLGKAVEAARYAIRPVTGEAAGQEYVAQNPAQGIRASFSPAGLELSGDSWRSSWRLRSIGYGRRQAAVGPARLASSGNRVELRRRAGVAEWYINGAAGLEQGFTLSRPPGPRQAGERLRLTIAVEGDLHPRAEPGGQSLSVGPALRYGHLVVTDARGRKLPAEMGVSADTVWLEVEDTGAAWPVTVDPTFAQQAYLKGSNTYAVDHFGYSVAVSGDTVVVGAIYEASNATGVNGDQTNNLSPGSGAAYVFVRNGSTWSQQAYLKASNTGVGDQFGRLVAVSGDTVVVGAILEASNATGVDGDQTNNSALESGAAYVFVRNGSTWSQQAYLKASNTGAGDLFGLAVAVSGDTVVVGAIYEDSNATGVDGDQTNNSAVDSGAAYVFVRNGSTWSQQAYLKASNTGVSDWFGFPVAVSGDTVVVGAHTEASNATGVDGDQTNNANPSSGAAYVFVRNGSAWSQQAYLKASSIGGDTFGYSVAVSGDTVVVGARFEDSNATGVNGDQTNNSAPSSGAAYVFVRNGGTWSQQAYLKASNTDVLDYFGISVAVSGDTVVVGAYQEDSNATGVGGDQTNNSAVDSGAAYVFVRNGGTWSQQAYLKPSNTGAGDWFGFSVGVSGNTVVVGAYFEDSSATGVNGDQTNNAAGDSGAAYVFFLPSNIAPAITPTPVTRQQGTSGSALIATVSDTEDLPGSLGVTVQSANPSNGVEILSIANSAGNVTADVAAACTASSAGFTLRVTDSVGATADGVLNVTVTPSIPVASASVGTSSLWPATGQLINVGLAASATGNCSPVLQVLVYSNEDDLAPTGVNQSPDAKDPANATLRLRAERLASGSGRVFLIVVKATNSGGNMGFAVATVVVPRSTSAANLAAVNAAAAAAASFALANNGSAPAGYFVVGDGPVVGPNQ